MTKSNETGGPASNAVDEQGADGSFGPMLRYVDQLFDLSQATWVGQRTQLKSFLQDFSGGKIEKFGDWSRAITRLWSRGLSDTFKLLTFPINFTRGDGQKVPVLVLLAGTHDTSGPRTVPVTQSRPSVRFTLPVPVGTPTNSDEAKRVHRRLKCTAREGELAFEITGGKTTADSQPIAGQYTSIAYDGNAGANRPLAFIYVVGQDGIVAEKSADGG